MILSLPRCRRRDLSLTQVRGQGVNSAQYRLGFRIINTASRACRARNYVQPVFVSAAGRVVPFRTQRFEPGPRPSEVQLRSGKPAGFWLAVGVCLTSPVAVARTVRFTMQGTPGTSALVLRNVILRRAGLPYCGTRRQRPLIAISPIDGG